ncbi:MAG: HEAT repeat domain-containing protein, partial [Proteobacteria bacterium]|nr:HEAT repeat domain-containing protein [Pseudomonadota bacterium]
MTRRRLEIAFGLALLGGLSLTPRALAGPSSWSFDWVGAVEVDAEGLASDLPKTRLDAVTALLGHDISLTKPYLLRAIVDDDPGVRQAAAKGLGAGGAVEAVPILGDWLSDIEPKIRVSAADALGEIGGPDATAALTRSLGDPDPSVRQHAVRALGAIGRRGTPGVVISIIPRLEDDKAEVKRESIEQLEALGDRRAVIPLVAKFNDGAPLIVTAAIRAIGKLGDRSAVPALIRLVGDPREEIKTAAVSALGVLGAIDAIDTLSEQLTVGSETYRSKVAYALGQVAAMPNAGKAGDDAMRTLVSTLAIPGSARRGAREGLSVAGKAAVPALVSHLEGRIPGDPTTVVELLAASPDPRATAALASELERGRVAMPTVLKSLGATGDPNALVPMLGALANKDAAIRLAAMDALRPLVGRDARAGDVLVEHLADEDLEIRVLAAEYLGILGAPTAMPR